MSLLPAAFLVRYRVPVPRMDRLPRSGAKLLDLPESSRLAQPRSLDEGATPFDLRAAWNAQGLGFSLHVAGRSLPVLSDPESPGQADSLELWLDTRDTQTVHRATRYCHHFHFLPLGGGAKGDEPLVRAAPVARARDDARLAPDDSFLARSVITPTGYLLEVWIPGDTLTGFDPATQSRLGFSCILHDAELGEIPFAAGDGFPVSSDPSLWHSLELMG